jgi:hypothetical protein
MNVGRAGLAALLYGIIVGVIATNLLPASFTAFYVSDAGSNANAIRTTIIPASRMLIAMIAAFTAGWWGTSKQTSGWLQQGLLIGAFVGAVGLALAAGSEGITPWTGTLLLDAAAAVGGAAVACATLRIRRAVLAAAMQVIARVLLLIVVFALFGASVTATGGGLAETAVFESFVPQLGLALGIGTAFLAGWWGARGLRDDAVRQGLLIGTLIFAFSLLSMVVLGGEPPPESVVLNSLDIVAAILGAMFAQRRTRAHSA